jgi:hypothetical protein
VEVATTVRVAVGVLDGPAVYVGGTAAVLVAPSVLVGLGVVRVPVGVGPTNGAEGSGHTNVPRLRVKAASVVKPLSMAKSQIMTFAMPLLKRSHTGEGASMLLVK